MTGNAPRNLIFNGDCIDVMQAFDTGTVDMILTDPPYVTGYRDRSGRTVTNDDNARWLRPAFREMHRVLKDGGFCASFYGWNKVDLFMDAWRQAGFRIVGHLVFRKRYASSARFLRYEHEQAYLLAKGNPVRPLHPDTEAGGGAGAVDRSFHPAGRACAGPVLRQRFDTGGRAATWARLDRHRAGKRPLSHRRQAARATASPGGRIGRPIFQS